MDIPKERIREAGYETLFILGGFLGLAIQPTFRNLDEICDEWFYGSHVKQKRLQQKRLHSLEKHGLIESDLQKRRWVPRLTDSGIAAFAGGRHPETAWKRPWDGMWRLLTFDLPRSEHPARMKLDRWLRSNHFGRIQGSVWIHPDPVPEIGDIIAKDRIRPRMMMVFEGNLAGDQGPREIAATAWDFDSVNAAYRR